MRSIGRAMVLAVAAVGLSAGSAQARSGGQPAIPLNPEQETGDVLSDASGFFTYAIEGNQLCYTLEVADLTMTPSAAHIHAGRRDVAGGVVVPLLPPSGATSMVSACISATESGPLTFTELAAIAADPRSFYVNVHTGTYPGGEVRGQLK